MKMKAAIRKPFLMKIWETYPKVWKFMIDLGILLKYKTLNITKLPDKITLPCSNVLYVNSEENRGRALLISNGSTQKRLTYFWKDAVQKIAPDLVIDVGVNYGECIFSTSYPIHTNIIGIEANNHLFQYINRSKSVHPNKAQMTLINAIASDKDEDERMFYVDKHWSGTSNASYVPNHNLIDKIPVRSVRIDSLLNRDKTYETVLFKVDVEGYEAFVLQGMTRLFRESPTLLGFIEFNSEYIEKLGMDIDAYLLFLRNYFTIYVYREDDSLINIAGLNFEKLQDVFGSNYIHTDLLLVKNDYVVDLLELKVE